LNAVIINPTGVFGPYDYQPSFFGAALLAMANGGCRRWLMADSIGRCAAMWRRAPYRQEKQAPSGAEYLLSGHWVSMRGIGDIMKEISDASIPALSAQCRRRVSARPCGNLQPIIQKDAPFYQCFLNALCANRNISHEKATRELGYQPRPLRKR